MVRVAVCAVAVLFVVSAATVGASVCACPRILVPVCGSDGRTYNNQCELKCAGKIKTDLKLAYEGKCKAGQDEQSVDKDASHCICTQDVRYVCGTDGRTYSNPCLLACAQKQRADLQLAHNGPCDGDDDVNMII